MSELKLIAPMLSNMEVVTKISEHAGTSVYVVKSIKSQTKYILKHISLPETQKQIDALFFSGAAKTEDDVRKYYTDLASDYQKELELLEMLSGSQNLACYRSYQIEPKETGIGYDVYLLSDYHKTLAEIMDEKSLTYLAGVNLGLDLCSALCDLRASNLIHRDVKPSNIYLNEQQHFVLGDLGIAQIDDLKYCSIPEHMISSFSAPELFDVIGSLTPTADLYSVGLILYRIFNGNHGPFEDERTSAKAADKLRVTGQDIPAPMFADYELANIILKACAYNPEDRYQSPDALKLDLIEYLKRNQVEDTLITPPIVADDEPIVIAEEDEIEPVQFADADEMSDDFKESFSPDTQMLNSIIESVHREIEEEEKKAKEAEEAAEENTDSGEELPVQEAASAKSELKEKAKTRAVKKSERKKKPLIAVFGILAALIAAVCLYIFVIKPTTIFIDDISLISKDANSITVYVKSGEQSGNFEVICSDAYGNSFDEKYVKGDYNSFHDLVPGTAYTISIRSDSQKTVLGSSTLHETTLPITNILSFDVTSVNLTQVELKLTVSGPEPESWTVAYGYDGTQTLQKSFSGHSVIIGDLESDKKYTFTLLNAEGFCMDGTNTASFSTAPVVDIGETSVALSSSKAIISWSMIGTAPEYWLVKYEGEDGSKGERKVTEPLITLEGLKPGLPYQVTISSPSMLRDGTLTIVPTASSVSAPKAERLDDGTYQITWLCSDTDRNNTCTLYITPKGAADESAVCVKDLTDACYVLSEKELLPNTTYTLSLELATGEIIKGDASSEFTTPTAKTFSDHGMSGSYIGLYAMPTKDDWTVANLSLPKSNYNSKEQIAFAIEGLGKLDTSATDEVCISIALRNENGLIVDAVSEKKAWNEMWDGNLFVGSFPRVPSESGKYTLEVFFDAKPVVSQIFTAE